MYDCRSDLSALARRGAWPGAVLLAALATGFAPTTGLAQVRDVISKEIAVGRAEASLRLELDGGGELDIAFRDGTVRIDGEEAGAFESGAGLEGAWRELLGTAVALDDGPLARALVDWEPPRELEGRSRELARRIDEALESALVEAEEGAAGAVAPPSPRPDPTIRSLLERTDRLDDLAEALEGLRFDDVQVRIGEDVVVGREVQLDATLVAVEADVEVRGTVRGDVVVVDGTLRVVEGARVTGDVRLAGSRLLDGDGEIDGSVVEIATTTLRSSGELRDRLRDELRRELRDDLREEIRSATRARGERDAGWAFLRPFRSIGRGIAGVLGVLLNTAVLALLGWGVVFFASDNLAVVSETARRSPGRSAAVGLAGVFLLLPVWILGALALVLTVVGIFALPFWIALFPLAVVAAAGLGFYAVASGVGEHLAGRHYPFLDWVRSSNAYTLVTGGLIVLAAPFLLANVVEMAVILSFLEGLLTVVGWMAVVVAVSVGFGAVLITRGGRRPDFYRGDPFDDDPDWPDDLDPSPRPGRTGPDGGDWFGAGATQGKATPSGTSREAAGAEDDDTDAPGDPGRANETASADPTPAGGDDAPASDDDRPDTGA